MLCPRKFNSVTLTEGGMVPEGACLCEEAKCMWYIDGMPSRCAIWMLGAIAYQIECIKDDGLKVFQMM